MMSLQCEKCELGLGIADTGMVKHWIKRTAANPSGWSGRLKETVTPVCPRCDAYALGTETNRPAPFYSDQVAAFLTSQDMDWWNDDPLQYDIRDWPDFGCLTFSETALRSAVDYFMTAKGGQREGSRLPPAPEDFVATSGIPLESRTAEWSNQLQILHERMGREFTEFQLDSAVRSLIGMLCASMAVYSSED